MLFRLNAAINDLAAVLLVHGAELEACNTPVSRATADKLVRAATKVVDIARAEMPRRADLALTQAVVDEAVADVLDQSDNWEPTAFRQWQQDVTA